MSITGKKKIVSAEKKGGANKGVEEKNKIKAMPWSQIISQRVNQDFKAFSTHSWENIVLILRGG